MKVLLVADLHMNLRQYQWLEGQANRFDLIVIAGDLLQLAYTCDKEEQISQILPILKRIRSQCSLLVSSGNHDGDTVSPAGEEYAAWIRNLEQPSNTGDSRYRFTLCDWWNGPETREEMLGQIRSEQPDTGVTWVWIHHAPPRGSKTAWTIKGDAGDPYLLKLIGQYNPNYVFSGHVHNAPFYAQGDWCERIGKSWVFNPGKQIGEVPSHIEIDLADQSARYSSLEGIAVLDLSK